MEDASVWRPRTQGPAIAQRPDSSVQAVAFGQIKRRQSEDDMFRGTSNRSATASATNRSLLSETIHVGAGRDYRLAGWLSLALLCGFLAYVARMHEITHDAFHEMCLFREALVQGEMPKQDLFAFTPTVDPSVHHEWGTGAVLYFATVGSGLGLVGLSLLKLLLMALLWLSVYRVARMRGAHPYVFAILACASFPVLWVGFATVRAQLFTLVFVAVQLWMQQLDWRGRRGWILAWLLMLIVWLNLHAGFVVGLGMIAFHSLERFASVWFRKGSVMAAMGGTWHLILAGPAACASLMVNPYGWEYIPYLIRAIGMERPLIREWQPLWNTYAPGVTLLIFFTSLVLFVYAQRHNRLGRLHGSAFLALCAYMTLKHTRHGSIFGVIWLAYVPAWISHTPLGKNLVAFVDANRQGMIRASQVVACTTFAFACFHHFWLPTLPPKQLYSTACYPTGAVDYLKENDFCGNLVTPFHVGSYVSWEMYPHVQVSFDGRYEVAYEDNVMPEHNHFLDARPGWWKMLDQYPVDAILVHRQAPVCQALDVFRQASDALDAPPTKRRWRFVYEDDSFVVLASDRSNLPRVDRRGQPLQDGAWDAFSPEHAHWRRSAKTTFARNTRD